MPIIDDHIKDTVYQEPKDTLVSVVIPCRNEYPQILGTILSLTEELEFWGYPYEFVVVSNQSGDGTPEILSDRFRNWVNENRLKVVEFNDKPACWHARNVGIENSKGQIVVVCDAHMSVSIGTLHNMIQLCLKHGGLWHSASQMWGDSNHVRLYGYSLKVEEKFWGTLSRHIPPQVYDSETGRPRSYTIPMAQYSLFLCKRSDFKEANGFHEEFRCYGGGEPYLAFKWWLLGKKCWIYPEGLVRHAFGLRHKWKEVRNLDHIRGTPYVKGKGICGKNRIEVGDYVCHYGRGYAWNNTQFWFNFLLAAYTIGGDHWLDQRYERYLSQCKGVEKYIQELDGLKEEVLDIGAKDREWISKNQQLTFDQLIEICPWSENIVA